MTSNLRTLATYSKHQLPTTGDTKMSANGADHEGWLLCDGRSLDIYEYNILYNTIGRSFGNGASATTFSLPNPKGRVPGVTGAGPGLTTRRLGDLVGQETVTLIEAQLPALTKTTSSNGSHTHTHNANAGSPGYGLIYRDGNNTASAGDATAGEPNLFATPVALSIDTAGAHTHTVSFGGGESHQNMQPTIFVGNMFIYSGRPNLGTYPYTFKSYKVPRS